MFSHNSVNFKLKKASMYKFIDFDHFQSIKENDIFHKIMWFLLFLCSLFEILVASSLLQFVTESIRLLWIKWLESLFREAENDSYYPMLLSLPFSKRMHVVRPKCIWKTRWKCFSFVIRSSINSFLTWKAVAVITCLKVFFSFGWPLHSKQRKNFLISVALGKFLLLQTFVEKMFIFLNKINTVV